MGCEAACSRASARAIGVTSNGSASLPEGCSLAGGAIIDPMILGTSGHRGLTAWLTAMTVITWSWAVPRAGAGGHHSLAGVYDGSKQVTVEGVVARFYFVNPHPYLTVTVKDANGKSADWRFEMDNRFELEAIGMTSASFSKGDRITASGSRGHRDANSLYIRRLDRASDGFWYEQVGSTPSVGRRPLHVISRILRSR